MHAPLSGEREIDNSALKNTFLMVYLKKRLYTKISARLLYVKNYPLDRLLSSDRTSTTEYN